MAVLRYSGNYVEYYPQYMCQGYDGCFVSMSINTITATYFISKVLLSFSWQC